MGAISTQNPKSGLPLTSHPPVLNRPAMLSSSRTHPNSGVLALAGFLARYLDYGATEMDNFGPLIERIRASTRT